MACGSGSLPLIMTHGWPGSVIELLEVVGPLTDPTAHGGIPEDAFDLVLPSLPGYGFSAEPAELGWNAGRVAQAWGRLMARLGYTRPSCSPPRFAPRSGHSASSQRPSAHSRRPSPSRRTARVCGRRRGRWGHARTMHRRSRPGRRRQPRRACVPARAQSVLGAEPDGCTRPPGQGRGGGRPGGRCC